MNKNKSCKSLMKKHLTKGVVDKLKDKTTSHGASLVDCIRSGQDSQWPYSFGVGTRVCLLIRGGDSGRCINSG